jgi:serine/threonine protein kinase
MKQKAFEAKANLNCESQPLHTLLEGDESSTEYHTVAQHVESCSNCLHRLEHLVADRHHWVLVGQLLREVSSDAEHETRENPDSNDKASSAIDRRTLEHVRGVLDAPKHPEMLGRLGRYDIESVVGRGGMGIVLRAFDSELHRPVAIKILASHLTHSGPARQRFARESRAAAAVVHEHVVAIHDVHTDGDTPYLVMQFVAGESLQTRVERQGPLSAKEILRIGMQAAAGLQAAHDQGVIHRDIKPANILLEPGIERALLTDFGLARTVDEVSLTQTGIIAGSPHYMSPEQAQGKASDARSDIFSLGLVLYYMATGHPPFRAEQAMGVLNRLCNEPHRPVWESHPEVPDALSEIIDRCLEKKASKRYASAAELQEALSRLLARLQHRPLRTNSSLLRQLRRYRIRLAATLATFVLLALFVTIAEWIRMPGDHSKASPTPGYKNDKQLTAQDLLLSYGDEVWRQANPDEQANWDRQSTRMSIKKELRLTLMTETSVTCLFI